MQLAADSDRVAVLEAAVNATLRQKRALVETAKLLSGNLDIMELFANIMAHAKDLMEVDRSTLFLYDGETNELWSKVADGSAPIRIPATAGIAGSVVQLKRPLNIASAYQDPRFNQARAKRLVPAAPASRTAAPTPPSRRRRRKSTSARATGRRPPPPRYPSPAAPTHPLHP